MNDIHTASDKFDMILYAEDTNLISPLFSFNSSFSGTKTDVKYVSAQINIEHTNIQEFSNINKLSLNVRKTKYMIFYHYQRNIRNISPILKINCEPIGRVTEFNFLGLTIEEHLSCKPHIQMISNKIARALGFMRRLKNFLPTNILRIVYNSLILPHLQYSVLSWGFKMGRLDKLQKRAVRIISNSKYDSHSDPLFKKFNLLKLKDLIELNVLKLFYKYRNNMLPFYVSNMFSDCNPDCNHKLETDILNKISTHSLQGFAFYIKRTMINKYQTECDVKNCYVIDIRS